MQLTAKLPAASRKGVKSRQVKVGWLQESVTVDCNGSTVDIEVPEGVDFRLTIYEDGTLERRQVCERFVDDASWRDQSIVVTRKGAGPTPKPVAKDLPEIKG